MKKTLLISGIALIASAVAFASAPFWVPKIVSPLKENKQVIEAFWSNSSFPDSNWDNPDSGKQQNQEPNFHLHKYLNNLNKNRLEKEQKNFTEDYQKLMEDYQKLMEKSQKLMEDMIQFKEDEFRRKGYEMKPLEESWGYKRLAV